MISIFSLGAMKQARVWRNELPFSLAGEGMFLQWETLTSCRALKDHCSLCCELVLLPRKSNYYGMMGLQYAPLRENRLIFTVAYTGVETAMFHESLLSSDYFPFKGLPEEHVNAVMRVIEDINISKRLPAGNYLFLTAAHDPGDPSSFIFSQITTILMKMMSRNPAALSENHLKELILGEVGITQIG